MTDFFNKTFTLYNDVPEVKAGGVVVRPRMWIRHHLDKCLLQGQLVQKLDGTIVDTVIAQTVITKDVKAFVPQNKYTQMSANERNSHYTVRTGDFIVFDKVYDVVEDTAEWADLQRKYGDNGIRIGSVQVLADGRDVDNIQLTSA